MDIGIEGFTIEGELGRGGFGVVHLARDEAHGRQVAIKTLSGSFDESARRRFDRERRAMGTLSGHPNIGVVHTSGFTPAGEPYIVMEYLAGGSLETRSAEGPMPVDEVVAIGIALSEALETAHAAGVLHLDVKPANVLYSRFGRPKIVDFGIAAIVGDEQATQTIRATPAFAAPEIFEGHPASPVSDVYGLAATMYALLTGGAPYTTTGEESALQILREVAISPVPSVERPDVPPELRQLLSDAMSKDPAERPPTIEAFRERLERVGQTPAPAPSAQAPPAPAPSAHAPPAPTAPAPTEPAPPALPPVSPPRRSLSDKLGQRIGLGLLGVAAVLGVVALAITFMDDDGPSGPAAEPTPRPTAAEVAEPTPTATSGPLPPPGTGPIVPDVSGLTAEIAGQTLAVAGYNWFNDAHCWPFASGSDPAAGTPLPPGRTVQVLFDPCVIPDYVGLSLDQAVEITERLIAVRIEWPAHCEPVVIGQSVPAGTEVEPFSTVVLLDLPVSC